MKNRAVPGTGPRQKHHKTWISPSKCFPFPQPNALACASSGTVYAGAAMTASTAANAEPATMFPSSTGKVIKNLGDVSEQ